MELKTVQVPAEMEPLFLQAQTLVDTYFRDRNFSPEQGSILIGEQRYILVRADSMSVRFFEFVRNMYPGLDEADAVHAASAILYDLAVAMGRADAKVFIDKMEVTDPIARLSCGPIHFAYSGWAFVSISPESRPSMDENYFLLYDHPYSFEAETWKAAGVNPGFNVCCMNAGYSSGWCQESFGIPLVAREVVCKANGGDACRFIMAPPEKIDERVAEYQQAHSELFGAT